MLQQQIRVHIRHAIAFGSCKGAKLNKLTTPCLVYINKQGALHDTLHEDTAELILFAWAAKSKTSASTLSNQDAFGKRQIYSLPLDQSLLWLPTGRPCHCHNLACQSASHHFGQSIWSTQLAVLAWFCTPLLLLTAPLSAIAHHYTCLGQKLCHDRNGKCFHSTASIKTDDTQFPLCNVATCSAFTTGMFDMWRRVMFVAGRAICCESKQLLGYCQMQYKPHDLQLCNMVCVRVRYRSPAKQGLYGVM